MKVIYIIPEYRNELLLIGDVEKHRYRGSTRYKVVNYTTTLNKAHRFKSVDTASKLVADEFNKSNINSVAIVAEDPSSKEIEQKLKVVNKANVKESLRLSLSKIGYNPNILFIPDIDRDRKAFCGCLQYFLVDKFSMNDRPAIYKLSIKVDNELSSLYANALLYESINIKIMALDGSSYDLNDIKSNPMLLQSLLSKSKIN